MLLFLFPFQVEYSSVNIIIIIIIIMVKDTVGQRHAITYVNNSKDIFATQVRWNVRVCMETGATMCDTENVLVW